MIITLKKYDNGGKIEVFQSVNTAASDFNNVVACCEYFAKQGAKTLIPPHFEDTIGNMDYEIKNIKEVYIRTAAGLELLYKKGAG